LFGINQVVYSNASWSRRQLLRIGGLSLGGIGLTDVLRWSHLQKPGLQAEGVAPRAARAKSCIFVYLFGGPSQLETFDLKPDAPDDFRGEFRPINTNVSGISISEHLPLLAGQADKFALIRSMTHEHPRHGWGLHHAFTGKRHPRPDLDAPPTPDDDPGLGALVNYSVPPRSGIPSAVTLPRWNKFNDLPDEYAGEKAGYLGKTFDPWLINADPNSPEFNISGIDLPAGLSTGRFHERLSLRHELNAKLDAVQVSAQGQRQDFLYRQAVSLITSESAKQAFDLNRESEVTRNLYGRHPFGQGLLLARRLVEAGTTLVTMNWHNDGSDVKSPFWDTHRDNFKTLKQRMLPPTDQGLAALLQDLSQRGMLDSTLVVVCGEFGRTPRIGRVVMNAATDATGRDHWPHAYSALIAGGGVRGGQVHGASDDRGAYVTRDPVTPPDLLATILWTLGIDRETILLDRLRRPHILCEGEPIVSLT
jgi:hypothetical protein